MQDIVDCKGKKVDEGLIPDDLKGVQSETKRDGKKVVDQIKAFLDEREINEDKKTLMLASFGEISKDSQRDELITNDKEVAQLLPQKENSVTKQIFTFIYENIFKSIDGLGGHIDIMGRCTPNF